MVLSDILDAVSGMTAVEVHYGPLLPNGGVTLTQSGGGTPEKHLDCNMVATTQIVIEAKSADQQTALESVAQVHKDLTKTFDYPEGDGWQIIDISTITFPGLSVIEANGNYIYNSVVDVTYYWRESNG